jgi:hypothetical protein
MRTLRTQRFSLNGATGSASLVVVQSTRRRNGQAAMQALILVATKGGPVMLVQIGIMRAIHRHEPRSSPEPRRKPAWGLPDRAIAERAQAVAQEAGETLRSISPRL